MGLISSVSELFRKKDGQGGGKSHSTLAASGAGLLLVLLILLIFILAATWLKAVFAGLLCAYLFLPLERFYERILQSKAAGIIVRIITFPFLPLINLKKKLMRGKKMEQIPAEAQREKWIESRTTWAAGCTVLTTLLILTLAVFCTIRFLVPMAVTQGNKMAEWAEENETAAVPEENTASERERLSIMFLDYARKFVPEGKMDTLTKQADDIANADFITLLITLFTVVGSFVVDLLMFTFFFFFFLQKMAVFRWHAREKNPSSAANDIGSWAVQGILNSGWLPAFSETAREHAEKILKQIIQMFDAWLRGYVTIILVETILYTSVFLVFGVPNAIPLGILAGLTILLPFLGPLISILLTVGSVLVFTSGSVMVPLIGVAVAYIIINGLLEQFFLYPTLVGEAIGLTTLETIITVLVGAAVAGIPGMIFAVPAAALLKFLVPLVYRSYRQSVLPTENVDPV